MSTLIFLSTLFCSFSVYLSHETWLLITFGKTASQTIRAIAKRVLECFNQKTNLSEWLVQRLQYTCRYKNLCRVLKDIMSHCFSLQGQKCKIQKTSSNFKLNRNFKGKRRIKFDAKHWTQEDRKRLLTCTSICRSLSSSALFFSISALSCSLCLNSSAESLLAFCLLRFCSTLSSRFRFFAACFSSLSILSKIYFITWLQTIILERNTQSM